MLFRVTFPLSVVLFNADKRGFPEVAKEAGVYLMETIPNPDGDNLCKWIVIKDSRIGISLVAFWEIERQIESARLPGIGRVEVKMLEHTR